MTEPASLTKWKIRHTILVWIGIILNLFFVLPLIFCPQWLFNLFQIPPDPTLWPRFAGLLLAIITIFYIPVTFDIDRYRLFAWLAVFPSRTFGTVFFALAVFVFGQPAGYLAGVFLDGTIGALTLYCLIRIVRLEAEIAAGSRS